jgi:hypothetical protein
MSNVLTDPTVRNIVKHQVASKRMSADVSYAFTLSGLSQVQLATTGDKTCN